MAALPPAFWISLQFLAPSVGQGCEFESDGGAPASEAAMKEEKSKRRRRRRRRRRGRKEGGGQIGVVSVKASRLLWMVAFAFAAAPHASPVPAERQPGCLPPPSPSMCRTYSTYVCTWGRGIPQLQIGAGDIVEREHLRRRIDTRETSI